MSTPQHGEMREGRGLFTCGHPFPALLRPWPDHARELGHWSCAASVLWHRHGLPVDPSYAPLAGFSGPFAGLSARSGSRAGGCTDDRGRIPSLAARPVELEYSEGITPPASAPASPPAPAAKSDRPPLPLSSRPMARPDRRPACRTPDRSGGTGPRGRFPLHRHGARRHAHHHRRTEGPARQRHLVGRASRPRPPSGRAQRYRDSPRRPRHDGQRSGDQGGRPSRDSGRCEAIEAVRDAVAARLAAQDALLGRLHG
jgi:hypothetical protein